MFLNLILPFNLDYEECNIYLYFDNITTQILFLKDINIELEDVSTCSYITDSIVNYGSYQIFKTINEEEISYYLLYIPLDNAELPFVEYKGRSIKDIEEFFKEEY